MSGELTTDVAVVGAGPAGASAATTLARCGFRVLLADRARFPRDKCCGDGLTTGALRRLRALGLDPAAVPSFTPVADLTLRSPSGRIARLPLGDGRELHAAVARRAELDAALVDLARGAGATVLEGHAFEELQADADAGQVVVQLAGGVTVRASYLVGADGAWSPVHRAVDHPHEDRERAQAHPGTRGAGRSRRRASGQGDWHAFRAYASGVGPEAAEHLWVWFDRTMLPGYAWSFPLAGGGANIGICMRRAPGQRGSGLAATWSALLDGPFLASLLGRDAVVEGPARSWPIPAGISERRLVALGGRVVFVGDAARAADPFTGEGIAQALETGVAAAEAIARVGSVSPGAVARGYAEHVQATLQREHRLSWLCTSLMAHPLAARGAVRVSGWNEWTRRNVGRWLYEDFPRTLAFTPSMWRREALGGGTHSAPAGPDRARRPRPSG